MDKENAKEILFEVDYWQEVLKDLAELNNLLGKIGEHTTEVAIVAAAFVTHVPSASDRLMVATKGIQESVLKSQDNLQNIATMANGRVIALREKFNNG